jgi:hypothetical protein
VPGRGKGGGDSEVWLTISAIPKSRFGHAIGPPLE